jgi:hypothetical protein
LRSADYIERSRNELTLFRERIGEEKFGRIVSNGQYAQQRLGLSAHQLNRVERALGTAWMLSIMDKVGLFCRWLP